MKPADGGPNLTPDCVVQVSSEYGIVSEMKKHYKDDDLRPLRQIKKYDQDLIGWWTPSERIATHDLVLLTHYFSSTSAQDAFTLWLDNNDPYKRKFAIVEFSYSDQGQSYFVLRRVTGSLSDPAHDERLRRGVKIPETVFIEITSRYKFYDAKPPLIHMLVLLQDYIFPTLLSEDQYDEGFVESSKGIEVTVEDIRERLQEQFCDTRQEVRQPALPKASWVREALDTLVEMDLGRETDEENRYMVYLRKPPAKDSVSYFTGKLLDLEAKRSEGEEGNPVQLPLPT
jgi:hypothetical protein